MNPIDFAFSAGLGPWLTPLRGKVPVFDAWQTQPPVDQDTVLDWIDAGYNLGLRCGVRSGRVVIDDDQARSGVPEADRWIPPPTDLVSESPTGGRHYYYVAPDLCPGNSASKLAPHVDVRGEGGQVVYPGSSHPKTGTAYRWVETGQPGTLPQSVLDVLIPPLETVRADMTRPEVPRVSGRGYGAAALEREAQRVATAPEGARHDTILRAATSLGELVAGGVLSRTEVVAALEGAAAGYLDKSAQRTIRDGLLYGAERPRGVPGRSNPIRGATTAPPTARPRADVLVPGAHQIPPDGAYHEQRTDSFCAQVLAEIAPGALYRRAGVVGEIHEGRFQSVAPERVRGLVDASMRLCLARESREDPGTYSQTFRPCTNDHARLALAHAETDPSIRELRHLATYPVFLGDQFALARPGWNADHGVFQAFDDRIEPLEIATARAVLDDLVCDFPWASPTDRANFFGLLLTPLVRPAIDSPVPMHLLESTIERSGKTKLAADVLGGVILGRPTPAMQLGVREEEREKRITALLLSGATISNLDNINEYLDSASLAALLTSKVYEGRELNHSRMLSLPNGLTLVGSGNNVHASSEIAKRMVPIRLAPPTDAPEARQDFRHANLASYVLSERARVLGALVGLVEHWKSEGRATGDRSLGGFERWTHVLGGIMAAAGYPEWLSNLEEWRGGADDFSGELREFILIWHERYACEPVAFATLYDLASGAELFERQTAQRSDHGRKVAFGQRVLAAASGRTIDGLTVSLTGKGRHRRARLERRCS